MPRVGQRISDAERLRIILQEVLRAVGLVATDRLLSIDDLERIADVFLTVKLGEGLAPPNPLIDNDLPF